MARYTSYVMAQSLTEAHALNQKKSSVIVAGNMWLRQCGLRKQTAIDLSALGLNQIEESEQGFTLGAMTTLRQLETHPGLDAAFGGAFAAALAPIVGTQFRNGATLGGSVFSRFGFSDVSTLLLALDAQVTCFARGTLPLAQFQQLPWDRDILTQVFVPKGQHAGVASVRRSRTDIPVLVCAASHTAQGLRIAVGARPGRALLAAEQFSPDATAEDYVRLAQTVALGSNARASRAYRAQVLPVLMQRAAQAACAQEGGDEP